MNRNVKKIIGLLMSMILVVGLVGCGSTDGEDEELVVNLGVTPYAHMAVMTPIFEEACEELGYKTELVEGDVGFMYLGMSQDDIDIYIDGWLPVIQESYMERYEGQVEVLDPYYEDAPIGIVVPSYMEDINTIEDLVGNTDLFNNRLIGIEPSAGMMGKTKETFEVYGIEDMELLESSTPAMLAEAERLMREEEPVVFLGWRPHIMFSKYDIKMLEDPRGVWNYDDVLPIVSTKFKEKAPEVYEFANNFEITVDTIEDLMYEAEETGEDVGDLTREWFAENREVLDEILAK